MPIQIVHADLFTHHGGAIAHGVNCKGAMGSGVAKAIKAKFPEMYRSYRQMCQSGALQPGGLYAYAVPNADNRWVYNIASQDRWSQYDPNGAHNPAKTPAAREEWLRQGLQRMFAHALEYDVDNIGLPLIGGKRGGLDPQLAESIITDEANQSSVHVVLYLPHSS